MRCFLRIFLLLMALMVGSPQGWSQWSTYAPMPSARWGLAVQGHNGRLYAISGSGNFANEAYNPLTNSWTTLAPIPVAVAYPAITAYAGKVYVIGGAIGSAWQSIVQIYDIATNTWSTGANTLSIRMGGTAEAYNGRIYLATGWNGTLMNSLEIYDIVANTWTLGAPAPTARYQTRSALIGGRMYVIGGFTSTWLGLNESYNIATNTWSTHAAMPAARYLHAAGSDGAQMYVGAGYAGAASGSFQAYNPVSNTWSVLPNVPTPRYRVDGSYLDGCFYIAGGFNGATLATLEGYCGLAILDANELTLAAQRQGEWVQLNWETQSTFEATQYELRRKESDSEWITIGMGALPHLQMLQDFAPQSETIAYQLFLTNPNGDTQTSNIATLSEPASQEGTFTYNVASNQLRFEPNIPFPMEQGIATLWTIDGKELREEKVSGWIDWNLADYPAGIYIFRWAGNGQSFQTKIVR